MTQVNKIGNEKEVATDTTEIQRILRDQQKQLNANKMNKFLERYNLVRLNEEEIENMKRANISSKILLVI